MAHESAGTFQQALRIVDLSAPKEPDIDVILEDIDIGECRVTYTRRRMSVMQQLSNIGSALAHGLEPALRDRPQFTRMATHPDLDSWISLDRAGKPQKLARPRLTLCSRALIEHGRDLQLDSVL